MAREPRDLAPVCVTKTEAARMLSMSLTSFEKYALPDLKVVRRGNLVLVPVRELDRWAERHADYTLSA